MRKAGTFGLIATNTIGQGDTRATGLRWICEHDGEIFAARKRVKWPGLAAVTVSVVHVFNGRFPGRPTLNDQPVDTITAFLFHSGGNNDPAQLSANERRAYQGFNVLGVGFTFDDADKSGIASPVALAEDLCCRNPVNCEAIFPYIGGRELMSRPTIEPRRRVIFFRGLDRDEAARRYPSLFKIVEERVKPARVSQKRKALRERWWQFAEKRPELFARLTEVDQVLVISAVTAHLAFVMCPSNYLFSHNLNVTHRARNGWLRDITITGTRNLGASYVIYAGGSWRVSAHQFV